MTKYYGRIDLDNMPPQELIRRWEREAKSLYSSSARGPATSMSPERLRDDYVWNKIAEHQSQRMKGGIENGI